MNQYLKSLWQKIVRTVLTRTDDSKPPAVPPEEEPFKLFDNARHGVDFGDAVAQHYRNTRIAAEVSPRRPYLNLMKRYGERDRWGHYVVYTDTALVSDDVFPYTPSEILTEGCRYCRRNFEEGDKAYLSSKYSDRENDIPAVLCRNCIAKRTSAGEL